MGVNKFYAIYEKPDKSIEIIDAFQAIKLVYDDVAFATKPKDKCPLFDIETYLKVTPVRRLTTVGEPYFKYYSDEESPLKGRQSTLEYTPELKTFIRAFEEIQSFKIEEGGSGIVEIFPKNMRKLQRIDTKESFVVLKFLVELKETTPYSYYYKYNGLLGLEFSVTSQPEPIKCKELGEKGIPLFRSNIQFPNWISVPDEFEEETQFEDIASKIRNTYQNRNYRLQGEFINQAINFPDYKEKYDILSEFERQCDELKTEREQLEQAINNQKQLLTTYELEKEKQRSIITKEKSLLDEYRNEIKHYEKMKEDNIMLKTENSNLVNQGMLLDNQLEDANEQIEKIKEDNVQLQVKNATLIEQCVFLKNKLENTGFLKKILKRKK